MNTDVHRIQFIQNFLDTERELSQRAARPHYPAAADWDNPRSVKDEALRIRLETARCSTAILSTRTPALPSPDCFRGNDGFAIRAPRPVCKCRSNPRPESTFAP